MAEKATQELERIYTIPLRETKTSPRNHQTDRAIRRVKEYLRQHMKAEEVWIDTSVNEKLWQRGMYKIPSRIRVRAVKFDDGVVEVSLPESAVKASIRGEIQERREKAKKEKDEGKEGKETAKGGKKAAKDEGTEAPASAGKKPPWEERKVIDIEGVGATFEAKLKPIGITLMDQLLHAEPEEVAEKTGISETLVRTWQAMADLDRLDTVNNQYAELLVRAGVAGVKALSAEGPETLVTKINSYLATVEKPPTTQAVTEAVAEEWIAEARTFQRNLPTGKPAAKKPDATKSAEKKPKA